MNISSGHRISRSRRQRREQRSCSKRWYPRHVRQFRGPWVNFRISVWRDELELPVILALQRLRQEDDFEFEVSLAGGGGVIISKMTNPALLKMCGSEHSHPNSTSLFGGLCVIGQLSYPFGVCLASLKWD